MNVNFRDKNFVIATFFFVITSARTIHVVAPPIILTCGVRACKCGEKRIEITLSRFELQSCIRGFQSVWTPFVGETRTGDF